MQKRFDFRWIIIILFLITSLYTPTHNNVLAKDAPQNEAPITFCITDIPSSNSFPKIGVNFRVFDQTLTPIDSIISSDIRISENDGTPVPIDDNMTVEPQGSGIDFYILINRSNRTNQEDAKIALNSFLASHIDKDQVTIYTDETSSAEKYYSSTSNSDETLIDTISAYSTRNSGDFYHSDKAVEDIINNIENDNNINTCQRPKFLILILGDDVIDASTLTEITKRLYEYDTKLIVVHASTVTGNKSDDEEAYRSAVESGNGYYISTSANNENSFLNIISPYRQTFSASYRTVGDSSGKHTLQFVYQGNKVPTEGSTSYTINLSTPQVMLTLPSIIERTTVQIVDGGYIYDKKDTSGTVQITFPDSITREISPKANLIIQQTGLAERRQEVTLSPAPDGSYQFVWQFGDIGDEEKNDFQIGVEIVDEFGNPYKSPAVPVTIFNYVDKNTKLNENKVNILIGVIILVVIIFSILLTIVWRRGGKVVQGVKNVAENIRKTIVGGGKRGKPLASISIKAGPPDMIGEDLKIYTERVKLGRDPQLADMTFYTPASKSSISGLHASIEKENGLWRIVAVSSSKSETFVDGAPIPFNQPYPLHEGQEVRLGYLAQQPVTFTFNTDANDAPRKTNVGGSDDDINRTDVGSGLTPFDFKASGETIIGSDMDDDDGFFDED